MYGKRALLEIALDNFEGDFRLMQTFVDPSVVESMLGEPTEFSFDATTIDLPFVRDLYIRANGQRLTGIVSTHYRHQTVEFTMVVGDLPETPASSGQFPMSFQIHNKAELVHPSHII